MSDLRDYLNSINELPDDVLLGRIVMFTVTDERVERAKLEQWFVDLNLNPTFIPAENRAIDSFKKATTDVDSTEYELPGNLKGILLTRNVTTDNEMVVRFIVREIRDSARRKLAHDKVIEAVFYKETKAGGKVQRGTGAIRLTKVMDDLEPSEEPNIDKAIQAVKDSYDNYYRYIDGQKIRAMVREYLKYLNAIEIKGGVYFVHKNRTDELLRLRDLLNRVGGGCRMDQIPIIDLDNERQIIVEAFQREAEESLSNLVKDIAFVRSTRKKVTPDAYAKLKRAYDRVMDQAMEYQRTLGLSQTRTSAAAELALDSLGELQKALLGDN
jgi:hypothetical protein